MHAVLVTSTHHEPKSQHYGLEIAARARDSDSVTGSPSSDLDTVMWATMHTALTMSKAVSFQSKLRRPRDIHWRHSLASLSLQRSSLTSSRRGCAQRMNNSIPNVAPLLQVSTISKCPHGHVQRGAGVDDLSSVPFCVVRAELLLSGKRRMGATRGFKMAGMLMK
ncbi:hypothetical protein EV363DRAFT_1422329 [Boletus edulis]|nr:hypothetical protein EV363DRAFT_1422329 [Boletus edulis]